MLKSITGKRAASHDKKLNPQSGTRWWVGLITGSCLIMALSLRLFQLQVMEAKSWQAKSDQNRLYSSPTAAGRTVILDRYGEPLIINAADYFKTSNRQALFSTEVAVTAEEGRAALATDSASIRQQFHRLYPVGPALAHVLGYVSPVTADELAVPDAQLTTKDSTGKQGLEKSADRLLRGEVGEQEFEISALGLKQRLVSETTAAPGAPLRSTLDPYLSAVAFRALGDNSGSVVIADAASGEVLSLVSTPSFDPNLLSVRYAEPASEAARRRVVGELFGDPRNVFFNRAVSGAYPPGSVFKLVTAIAALQSGKVTASTEIIDEGVLRVGDFTYANWYYTQYGGTEGAISLQRAIARSNDIYFYKAAELAGPESIASLAHQLGYGQPTGIELPGEVAGLVPDPKWKELTKHERWFLGNTYHYGIGQGDLQVTPLQVAQMTQAIANNGERCDMHLIKKSSRDCHNLSLSAEHVGLVVAGMIDACSPGGTAFPFFEWNRHRLASADANGAMTSFDQLLHEAVACKTGTAEFGATDEKGYKKTHGWFTMVVGMDPLQEGRAKSAESEAASSSGVTALTNELKTKSIERYFSRDAWLTAGKAQPLPKRLVITVLVESDEQRPYREGSRDAAPVAKAIVDWMVGSEVIQATPSAQALTASPSPGEAE